MKTSAVFRFSSLLLAILMLGIFFFYIALPIACILAFVELLKIFI